MNRRVISTAACVAIALAASLASAQQRSQPQSQRPAAPMPPAEGAYYRTFTATQLAQSDRPVSVNPTARRGPAATPNTANVVEEIFRRGLGPIVLGVSSRTAADGTTYPPVVLKSQQDVSALLRSSSRGGSSAGLLRLQKNLAALKVNMIVSGNGITVNGSGGPFGELSLVPEFSAARFPIFNNCEECKAGCPDHLGVCFMTVDFQCRCYLFNFDVTRGSVPPPTDPNERALPRRIRDLAAYADTMLTNWPGFSAAEFETVNETIEIINGAFASDPPFGAQDIVRWGGGDGGLVLASVRPLSEAPFLVNQP